MSELDSLPQTTTPSQVQPTEPSGVFRPQFSLAALFALVTGAALFAGLIHNVGMTASFEIAVFTLTPLVIVYATVIVAKNFGRLSDSLRNTKSFASRLIFFALASYLLGGIAVFVFQAIQRVMSS